MASVSSLGIGSGIDAESIVTQLVALERKPIETINKRTETLQSKLSAFALVQSYMTNLQDATDVLAKASTWQQTKVSSADETSISASTTTGAAPGSLAVQVTQLAQSQSLVTPAYTSSLASMGSGTLRIELGTWSAGNADFTQKTGSTAVDVVIAPGQDSMEAIRTAINAANAGVSASIVRDATGARLALRSTTTGLENGLRITATADAPATPGGATLDGLVYNPPAGTSPLTETQVARDAMATVNGLAVTSPRNTLTGVVEGLTLDFKKVTTSPVQLSVSNDTTAMRKAVDDFAKAYNDLNKYVAEQTKYDPDKKVAATLQGDRATLSLQTQLRAMVGSNGAASAKFTRLSDIGIQIQADGSLKVNDTKFGNATSALNLPDLALAFSQKNGTASVDGFATRISALVGQLTGSQGTVTTRSEGLRASIKRSESDAQKASDRADATEVRLRRQYSALDTSMAKLNGLSTYVSQQITNWNKSN